mgnify:CR=1 FL=1|tara:strand:+ start:4506 stop:5321 length:816 start_codon:yes stop_codon:yes gene_type:complete
MVVRTRPTKTEINQLKKADAIEMLGSLGLPTDGTRLNLQKRVLKYYYEPNSVSSKLKVAESDVSGNKSKDVSKNTEVKLKDPSKSVIRKMKKDDIVKKLQEFCLQTDGNKEILVNRLDEYYRPNNCVKKVKKNLVSPDLVFNRNIPTRIEIQKMKREVLEDKLLKLGLSTDGACIELSARLIKHYHPLYGKDLCPCTKESNVDADIDADIDDNITEEASSRTTPIQVIEYEGRKIGIIVKGLVILEYNEDEDTWKKTKLSWNLETWQPNGF